MQSDPIVNPSPPYPPLSLTHVPVMTSCFVSMLSLRMVEMEDSVRKKQAQIAALSCRGERRGAVEGDAVQVKT